MAGKLFILSIPPGIQKDGTSFSSRKWTNGEWVRFYRGLPRKMEGYKQLISNIVNVPRGTIIIPNPPNFNVYVADQATLKYFTIDQTGTPISGLVNRTPNLFNVNANNDWSFDVMFSSISNSSILVAYAGQNLGSIDNTIETPIYYGDASGATPLIPTGINTSGGIVALHPFLFIFGNNGTISWTNANDPTTLLNTVQVASSKIVAGARTRGGNTSPAGLFWSLDALIRATNTGPTAADFTFDTVTDQSSILSNKSIIQYDGTYYWATIDRFLTYNGVVQELPNDTSLNFFFSNLNYAQRQKVWATKVSEWGEIWWHFPMGDSTECNHAIVYNYRERTWYDTPITRSAGDFDQTFQFPIWCDNTQNLGGQYTVWQHETGTDQNINGVLTAIDSFIETPDISLCAFGPDSAYTGVDRWIQLDRFEPDFIMSGNMTLTANTRFYAQAPVASSAPVVFTQNTQKIDLRGQNFQGRLMTLTFESNVIGGNFEMGNIILLVKVGDGRQGGQSS